MYQTFFVLFIVFSEISCSSSNIQSSLFTSSSGADGNPTHTTAVIAYLQRELERDPQQPRAAEYQHILKQHISIKTQNDQGFSCEKFPVNFQNLNNRSDLPQKKKNFGVYDDSIDDATIKDRLVRVQLLECGLFQELREHWKSFASNAGVMPKEISQIQQLLEVAKRDRYKIAAVQQFRQSRALIQSGIPLTPEMQNALQIQQMAYLSAKSLQGQLSVISKHESGRFLAKYVRERIKQNNCTSIEAGISFVKMYNQQNEIAR